MSDLSWQGQPDFYKYKSHFDLKSGERLSFYLDLSKNDTVLSLHFEWNGASLISSQINRFCSQLKGQVFDDYPCDIGEGEFVLTPLIYRQFVQEVRGISPAYHNLKGRPEKSLVCRCFGVYEEDIHQLVGTGISIKSLRDLGDHLQAGIGCGTCHQDLRVILDPLIPVDPESPKEEELVPALALWEKLDPQSLAREAFQVIKAWNEANNAQAELKGTKPGSLLLGLKDESLRDSLMLSLTRELGRGLDFLFI